MRTSRNIQCIPISSELKTLILSTSNGYVALHICGNRQVNLREIKVFLKCKQACLASPSELHKIGLEPGKVCPLIEPTWSMQHLVSKDILGLERVPTNDGAKRGYYIFNPIILLHLENYEVGYFVR